MREYGEKQDEIAISEFGGEIANPFADSADLCSNKLINYYQFVDNPFVLLATVLDPRGKLKIYLKSSHPVVYAEKAKDALKAAFAQYSPLHESDEEEPTPFSPEDNENTNEASIFDGLEETAVEQQEPVVSEVDRYLAQNVVPKTTNVLNWWKQNSYEFPVLSRMAKDYLAIQCSSKDTEGSFSKGRRGMPYYRQNMQPLHFKAQMLVNSGEALGMFD